MLRIDFSICLGLLFLASSCVRFIKIEDRFFLEDCQGLQERILSDWEVPPFRGTSKGRRINCPLGQNFHLVMTGPKAEIAGEAKMRIEFSPSPKGRPACEITIRTEVFTSFLKFQAETLS